MKINSFALGQLQANCYLLEQDDQCLLIDPGDSADTLLEEIQRRNLELVGIIATHGHFDHIMAVGEIQLSYPHLSLHIHSKDHFLLDRLGETAKYFLGYDPTVVPVRLKAVLVETSRREVFTIGDFQFQVIHTPGHTPGSCSLYFKDQNIIFTGDTIFKDGIGRYDFKYSDKDDLKKSIKKILELPGEIVIYPGHGEETMVGEEKGSIDLFF